MRRHFALLAAVVALLAAAPDAASVSARRKIDLIQQDRVPPGSVVTLRQPELNAYVRSQVAQVAPQGVRDPRIELGASRATAFAYIDFPKLRQSQGRPMGWLASRLLGGERPVRIDTHIRSGGGRATVYLDRVVVSGFSLSGAALDYVIRNFLWQYYPDAKIGRPFELAHRIDRLEVAPSEVRVVIGR